MRARRALLLGPQVLAPLLLLSLVIVAGARGDERLPATLDVSGRPGHAGADGPHGRSAGASGGDAGPAAPGEHAGGLDLTLEGGPGGRLVVRGSSTRPRPQGAAAPAPTPVDLALEVGEDGVLRLLARGGAGGRGGHGGHGATGSTGSRGSDATCHRSGGSGGRGGDGGDGGRATSGAAGGAGGDVVVRVTGDATHLLLLVEPHNDGGRGGGPGNNGRGGQGGSGGSGGSRHSSHGTGERRCSGNSGGSSGPSGRSGTPGTAHVVAGADGAAGRVVYVVDGVEHADRYRLELVGFEVASADDDGVHEPGEEVVVRGLRLRNRGALATPAPALHETHVYLPLTRNVTTPTSPLLLPLSLAPGQETALAGELRFRIPDVDTGVVVRPNTSYADEGVVGPRAHLVDARRDHPECDLPRAFPIGFPVRARPVRFGSAMGAGEARRVVLEVENVSTRALGAGVEAWQRARGEPLDPARRRGVHLTLGFDARTLGPRDVLLLDAQGAEVDLARGALRWDVDALGPGEVARLEVTVGLRPDADPYAGGDLALDLHLGRLAAGAPAGDDRRVVERLRVPVRVAARWQPPTRPSLLLVTNMGVEREVVRAWRDLAGSLGYGLAVWDVSYHGYLPLAERREGRADAAFTEAAREHLVVVLGNAFAAPGVDGPVRATALLDPDEVVRAAARAGVRVLVVGDEAGAGDGLLLHAAAPTVVREHASTDDLLLALEPDEAGADAATAHRAPLVSQAPWARASRYDLEDAAHDLSAALAARFPGRRYVVVARYAPGQVDGRRPWSVVRHGVVEVRRTQDADDGGVDVLAVPDADLAGAAYLATPQAREAVLRALPFSRKLEVLAGVLAGALPTHLADPAAAAVIADLAVEVDLWTRDGWSGLATSGAYRERLRRHAALGRLTLPRPLDPATPDDPRVAAVVRVAAAVEVMARRAWGAGDVVVPLRARRYYVAAAIAGTLGDGLADDLVRAAFGDGARAAARLVDAEVARLGAALGPGRAAIRRLRAPTAGDWTHRPGADLLAEAAARVVEEQAAETHRATQRVRADARAALLEGLDRLRVETELGEGVAPR